MINEVGVDPVARDSSGMSTTHAAAMGHQYETVKVTQYTLTNQIASFTPANSGCA